MAGRPAIIEPVFMNVWAGSWLMASVWSERTMHRSSAHFEASSGQITLIDWPDWPHFWNGCCGAKTRSLAPLKLGDLLPLRDRLGHRLAVELFQEWLVIERVEVAHSAGHVEPDDPLGPRDELGFVDGAAPAALLAVAAACADFESRQAGCQRHRTEAHAGIAHKRAAADRGGQHHDRFRLNCG